MPRLEYFVVSEGLSVDQRTNNVSLFGVCEEYKTTIPGFFAKLVATSSWNIDPEEHGNDFQATLRVKLNEESVLPELDNFKINFTTDRDRHRIFHYIDNLKVMKPGNLVFEILLDGKHQAYHTVTVRERDEND